MAEISTIEPNVDLIVAGDKTIYLVGTAHVSSSSTELVQRIIDQYKPDAVAVELCASRFESIRDPARWKKTDVIKIFLQGKPYLYLTQLVLAAFQKKIANKLNIKPGAEMIAAVDAAEKSGAAIILADREVRTTLKRTWASVRWISIINLFLSSLWGMIKNPTIDEAEIERLKSPEALENLLKEFAQVLPDVKLPLIDERDLYLTSKIRSTDHKKVVAVVGAGHSAGIKAHIEAPIDTEELDRIPPTKLSSKILRFLFPLLLCLFTLLACNDGRCTLVSEILYTWFKYISIGTAIGLILVMANPITIVFGSLLAPVASLLGFGATGWLAGFIQANIKKARESDKETLLESVTNFKTAWKNRASKAFMVMIIANITSTISTIWAIKAIVRLLYWSN